MEIAANEFKQGVLEFQKHEKRDAMYKIATFLIEYFWGKPDEMADSLGVLLLTWNQAFYRYGPFDYDKLEQCISQNMELLNAYRQRSILSYSIKDDQPIRDIFKQFLAALQICEGKNEGNKSSVGVAKALHLLAPNFFPIWDKEISQSYGCFYGNSRFPEDKYIQFLKRTKVLVQEIQSFYDHTKTEKTALKLIDEYNYAKYTKGWI